MTEKQPAKKTPNKQREGRRAIIEDDSLPRMGELEISPRRIKRKILTMPEKETPYRGTKNLMDPVPGKKSKKADPQSDQEEAPIRGARGGKTVAETPGYVRLRIRVEEGELSVVGATFVDGPLVQTESAHAGLSYEVKIGRRRVAFGDVPEMAEWRSHPDPMSRAGLEGHHITTPTSYEFTARVPANELGEDALDKTQVSLYQWEGRGPGEAVEVKALAKEPKGAVTTVGVLKGIKLDELSKGVQRDLKKAVR